MFCFASLSYRLGLCRASLGAEQKIEKAENSTSNRNDDINAQIEKEQKRIDNAYTRIQPAIEEQQKIIADARDSDADRTKPYEDQLTNIKDEIKD